MLEHSFTGFLLQLNSKLGELCRSIPDAAVLDVHGLQHHAGLANWRDDRMAWLARAPLSGTAMSAIAQLAARHLKRWSVPPSKCLVLDMDNTIWGGVLGEAGITGIQLGPDYPGSVFLDFQRRVLALRERGVLLAAASKNNAADVEAALREHPSCLLKREHFSAFEVHWEDKATSLRRIARTLSIGLDSLVFFDDNPVEREWVKSQLPEVSVPEVPATVTEYGRCLESCEEFDIFRLTQEDINRSELYRQEAARTSLGAQASSLEDFIRGLEMTVTIHQAHEGTLPRIVQLLGKTNQFNLTTQRHDLAAIQTLLDSGAAVLTAHASDRFGDAGLVAVAIAKCEDGEWIIDSFLMSCRVIGRGIETALLAHIERHVREAGGRTITGVFLPTAKNRPAADFYPLHGYKEGGAGSGLWHLDLDELRPLPDTFKVVGPPNILP